MKKILLLAISAALMSSNLIAGGIMTNTNQSAAYARLLARNASLGIDAVYYNPAGLTKLGNGFHLSLNNQTIFQTKDVVNSYPYLHGSPEAKYTGIVEAPVFPGVYAAYKIDKLAFSFGFNPVGGGGGATYDKGLPSFEMPISDLVPMLGPQYGVTDYKADINFEGTSVYFGYQFGVSYEINPSLSLFAGIRTVTAKNTYKGAIRNVMINPTMPDPPYNGAFIRADEFGKQQATYYTGVSDLYGGAADGLGLLVDAGAGGLTSAQCVALGYMTPAQKAQMDFGLTSIGQSTDLTIAQSQGAFQAVSNQAAGGAATMTGLAAKTADAEVDVEQTGTGYTPMFGANITLAEKLTLAIKYEMITKIELTNKTKVDGTGTFPEGGKTRADMPALLSIGASYPVTSKLNASLGFNYYWDKKADYGKKDMLGNPVSNDAIIDKNFYELAFGLEYNFTEKFLLSAGYLMAKTGVSEEYQNDLSYSNSSNTVGFGGRYKISPAIGLNIGALYTMYAEDSKTFDHKLGTNYISVTEDYTKSTWLVAIGLDIKIGK